MIILLQLSEDFVGILCTCKPIHDFKLCELDVDWVIVFAEEDFDIVLQNSRPPLNDEENISQCNILHFRARREKGYWGMLPSMR